MRGGQVRPQQRWHIKRRVPPVLGGHVQHGRRTIVLELRAGKIQPQQWQHIQRCLFELRGWRVQLGRCFILRLHSDILPSRDLCQQH